MKKTIITLTQNERYALSSYPSSVGLQYIWIGILAMRGIAIPSTLDELNVKYLEFSQYEITTPDYSLAG